MTPRASLKHTTTSPALNKLDPHIRSVLMCRLAWWASWLVLAHGKQSLVNLRLASLSARRPTPSLQTLYLYPALKCSTLRDRRRYSKKEETSCGHNSPREAYNHRLETVPHLFFPERMLSKSQRNPSSHFFVAKMFFRLHQHDECPTRPFPDHPPSQRTKDETKIHLELAMFV